MMDRHNQAWKCWEEIIKKLKETNCYMKDGELYIGNGCGGDFVKIIERYI